MAKTSPLTSKIKKNIKIIEQVIEDKEKT